MKSIKPRVLDGVLTWLLSCCGEALACEAKKQGQSDSEDCLGFREDETRVTEKMNLQEQLLGTMRMEKSNSGGMK